MKIINKTSYQKVMNMFVTGLDYHRDQWQSQN